MLYLYDNAIVDDLKRSFNPDNVPNPVVAIVGPDHIVEIAAQLQDDEITLPIVAIGRDDNIEYDMSQYNFSRVKKGVIAEYDSKENTLYLEKAIPINLKYDMLLVATNQADLDELTKEIIFKYSQQYFLTIHTPYEAKRPIHFGIEIIPDSSIEQQTSSKDYMDKGTLYQAIIHLQCHGAVILSYTPRKVTNFSLDNNINLQ